jgi:GH25 family lysozyme M1 (1,4-beta-N-acetylmuramidase)
VYEQWWPAVDWSDYQPTPDFGALMAAGVRLGWRKASQGARFREARYRVDRDAANAAGFAFGAYHFPELVLTRSPAVEAERFAAVTDNFAGCQLPPMIDLEEPPGQPSMLSTFGPSGIADLVAELCERVEALAGRCPVLYASGLTNPCANWIAAPRLARIPVWVAHYGSQRDYGTAHGPDFRPGWTFVPPRGVGPVVAVQHSGDNGRCPGFPHAVDLDLVDPSLLAGIGGLTVAEADRIMERLERLSDGIWVLWVKGIRHGEEQHAEVAQWMTDQTTALRGVVTEAVTAAVSQLTAGTPVDPAELNAAVGTAVTDALARLSATTTFTANVPTPDQETKP